MTKELNGFEKVCRLSDLQETIGQRFIINDVDVAIFKVNGEVYALNNICPHQHASIIYDGFVDNGCVICPAHGWEFKLKDGKMHTGGSGLDPYEVKIINEDVYVKVYEKDIDWDF